MAHTAKTVLMSQRDTWLHIKVAIDSHEYWLLFLFTQEAATFCSRVEDAHYSETKERREGFELLLNVRLALLRCHVAMAKKEFMDAAQFAALLTEFSPHPYTADDLVGKDLLCPALPIPVQAQIRDMIAVTLFTLEKLLAHEATCPKCRPTHH